MFYPIIRCCTYRDDDDDVAGGCCDEYPEYEHILDLQLFARNTNCDFLVLCVSLNLKSVLLHFSCVVTAISGSIHQLWQVASEAMDPVQVAHVLAIRDARREAWLLRWCWREWLNFFYSSLRTVRFQAPSPFMGEDWLKSIVLTTFVRLCVCMCRFDVFDVSDVSFITGLTRRMWPRLST